MLPILEYSSQVWNPHTQKNVKKLEDVQLRAARWVCGSCYSQATHPWEKSSHQCCRELNWPALSVRREYLSLLSVHDILHGRFSLNFTDLFSFSSSCTRSHSLSLCCKSSTIFLWNRISYSILSITDCNSFKNRLYRFLTL